MSFGFGCITNNDAGNCAIGEAQLSVDVTDPGGGQIDFTFFNVGGSASSITDVYWDDGTLLSIVSITNTPGLVEFGIGASPGNLPGGNTLTPPFVASFSADSEAPVPQNGVNPGETLTVRFALIGGATFADAIAALGDGDLRVGVHVQAFANGGSESFVVPEPDTAALVVGGLVALGAVRRRR